MYLTANSSSVLGGPLNLRGVVIYAQRPFKKHFGIALFNYRNEIVAVVHPQPGRLGEPITVVETDYAAFAKTSKVFFAKMNPKFSPEEVANRAVQLIGSQDYDLFKRNCEHYGTWAATGDGTSQQIKDLGTAALVIAAVVLLAKAG
ncbi:MAG: lecithin retinol acyltransferase family protein [Planctomycetia bacterium]|nr:lecithin retinol acyltransferase family protein [Planctomycetia bacterium]